METAVVEMERHSVLLVELADEIADIRPEDVFHRDRVRCDHVRIDIARAQRRRHLEADEARANHYRPLRNECLRDKGAAVGERAQVVHMFERRPRYIQPHRLEAGGEQQLVVGVTTAVGEQHVPALRIERGSGRIQFQVDAVLPVERRRTQRIRFCGRRAREEALRKVGTVTRP